MAEPRIAVDVDIPSDVKYIEEVVGLVMQACRELNLPSRKVSLNVPVALTEALSNAILRGNRDDHSKHVHVRATISDKALVLDVVDEGKGFDFARDLADPTLPENLEKENGRGLFLMRKLMDKVEQFQKSTGNVVRMTLLRR